MELTRRITKLVHQSIGPQTRTCADLSILQFVSYYLLRSCSVVTCHARRGTATSSVPSHKYQRSNGMQFNYSTDHSRNNVMRVGPYVDDRQRSSNRVCFGSVVVSSDLDIFSKRLPPFPPSQQLPHDLLPPPPNGPHTSHR